MKILKTKILILILLATSSTQLVAMKRARSGDADLPAQKKLKAQVDPKAKIAEPSNKFFTIVCHDGTEIKAAYATLALSNVFQAGFNEHEDIAAISNRIEIDNSIVEPKAIQFLINGLNPVAQEKAAGLSEQNIIDNLVNKLEPKEISNTILQAAYYLEFEIFFKALNKLIAQRIDLQALNSLIEQIDKDLENADDFSLSDDNHNNNHNDQISMYSKLLFRMSTPIDWNDEIEKDLSDPSRPFVCIHKGCGKAFAQKSKLITHERIHTGEKPFVCNHEGCGKAFSYKNSLVTHKRIHTGEKPFVCTHEGCGKAFTQQTHLTNHKTTHIIDYRPFVCTVDGCGQAFTLKQNLKKHLEIHDGKKPFECPHENCNYASNRKEHLKQHMKTCKYR